MATDVRQPSRFALVVANSTYDDETLRQLRAPSRDAEELARVLGDSQIGGFQVQTSTDEPQHVLVRRIARFFEDCEREDVLLLHISSHGVKDEDGNLYFAATDTEANHLDATGLRAEFLNRQMAKSPSRSIVLFLDCCFSGAFAKGALARGSATMGVKESFDGQGKVVLTSSNSAEYSFEGTDVEGRADPSYFTTAIVRGLETGAADQDGDDRVSVDELYDYVFDEVRRRTPNQTPCKWVFDVRGDIYIARNANPAEITTASLPEPLLEALDHPLPSIREAAAGDLKRLLGGRDQRVARAAKLALTGLLIDDSLRVREVAGAALGQEGVPAPTPPSPEPPRPGPAGPEPEGPRDNAPASPVPTSPPVEHPSRPREEVVPAPEDGTRIVQADAGMRFPTWATALGVVAGVLIVGSCFLPLNGSGSGRLLSMPGLRLSKYGWSYLDPLVMGSAILVLAVRARRYGGSARFAAIFMLGSGVMTTFGGVGSMLWFRGLGGSAAVSAANAVWCLGGLFAVAAAMIVIRGNGLRTRLRAAARPIGAWICLAGAAIMFAGLVADLGGGYRILSGGSPPSWYLGIEVLAGIGVTLVVAGRALRLSARPGAPAVIAVGLQAVLYFLNYACSWLPYGFDFAIGDLVGLAGAAVVLAGGVALWRHPAVPVDVQPSAPAAQGAGAAG